MQNQPNTDIAQHVAIIPDGNRRWAQLHRVPVIEGHRRGADAVNNISRYLRKKGVKTITLWGFSTENWTRPKVQVEALLKLFEGLIDRHFQDALKEKVCIKHIGRKDRLPANLIKKIREVEQKTEQFSENFLNIGIDYGGRDEILRATQEISNLKSQISNLTEESLSQYLDTADQPYPDPDIVIRTGGEQRLSGFMLWQSAYAELFFIDKLLPDLVEEDIDSILQDYRNRQRRFGT